MGFILRKFLHILEPSANDPTLSGETILLF